MRVAKKWSCKTWSK